MSRVSVVARTCRFQLMLTEDESNALDEMARVAGMDRSTLIRLKIFGVPRSLLEPGERPVPMDQAEVRRQKREKLVDSLGMKTLSHGCALSSADVGRTEVALCWQVTWHLQDGSLRTQVVSLDECTTDLYTDATLKRVVDALVQPFIGDR